MRKRLILVLALALVAGLTIAAYAEVQNVKVSGDLSVIGVSRYKLALKDESAPLTANGYGHSISAMLSTVRVKVEADLTDNVMATVRLINERKWGAEGSASSATNSDTNIDIDLAYATMKEFLYSPLSLTIGRQELRFGNGLVIGDPDTNGISAGHGTTSRVGFPDSLDDFSSRKAFDAMRATLNYDPLIVDMVYSKISDPSVQLHDDADLYGVNASYAVSKDLNAEVYTWQRSRESGASATANGINRKEKLNTSGAKATYTGIKNLILGAEGAFQYGEHLANRSLYVDEGLNDNTRRKATGYAIQAIANYVMPDKKLKPSVGGSYTFLSGEKYQSEKKSYRGWDPMYEDQAGGTLFNKILGYSNAQLFNVNGSVKPMDDVTMSLNYYYLRLVKAYPDVSDAGSKPTAVHMNGVTGDPTYDMAPHKSSLGQEVDLAMIYNYTEDVQFGLSGGAFVPGNAFSKTNRDTAKQVIGSMKVTF
ncbi:MAG: alginate export family protein [Candidatus Omnitrophica bacterium]|nr:alginate export family protein [Candidatus Omnitrophota bacterium]